MNRLDQVLFKKFKESFAQKTQEEIMERCAFHVSIGRAWKIDFVVGLTRLDSLSFYKDGISTISPLDPTEQYNLIMLLNEFIRQLRDSIEKETWVGLREELVEELLNDS